eukprot:6492120-Amphidinium_carterae.2
MMPEAFSDWGVQRPRTVAWCLEFINRRGGGPLDHHRYWRTTLGMSKDAWGVAEHEMVMKQIDQACCYDALDVTNLSCFETALRKAQLIEYAYHMDATAEKDSKQKGKGKGLQMGLVDEYSRYTIACSLVPTERVER